MIAKLILVLIVALPLFGEPISALYLSWYGDPTTTMTIQWHTALPYHDEPIIDDLSLETSDGWIPFTGSHEVIPAGYLVVHTVSLSDLTPDTLYRFQIGAETHTFRTMPSTLDHPVRFVVGGDAYMSERRFRRMNQTIASLDPDFVVIGGDIAYTVHNGFLLFRSSPLRRWATFFSYWKEQMIASDGRLIPFLIIPGNHDIAPDQSDLFFTLFAFPTKQLYRAIDFSNYLTLFLLDTNHYHPIAGEQTDWLKNALAARSDVLSTSPFTIPFASRHCLRDSACNNSTRKSFRWRNEFFHISN